MMPHNGKLCGGSPPETGIHPGPASCTNEDRVLSRLNRNYRQSKAQQILRLLWDQEALNQLFRQCDLLDDDNDDYEDDAKGRSRGQQGDNDGDAWSLQNEKRNEEGDSDQSENKVELRAVQHVALKRHHNSIDPGRCKTSMGFCSQAEVTGISYVTDSDNINDSACSTPRGVNGVAPVANQPSAKVSVNNQASLSRGSLSSISSARLSKHPHPNAVDSEVTVKELSLQEECLVHSACSRRPKTSLISSSMRNRYYRQQPHPEAQYSHLLTSHPKTQLHPLPQPRSLGDTRQDIISSQDLHYPMELRSFCESRATQEEAARTTAAAGAGGRGGGGRARPLSQPLSQPLLTPQATTPTNRAGSFSSNKASVSHQFRTGSAAQQYNMHHPSAAFTLQDMTSLSFTKEDPVHTTISTTTAATTATPWSRAAVGTEGGEEGESYAGKLTNRSTSFLEHKRMVPTGGRVLLSVDSSPIQFGEVCPKCRLPSEDIGGGVGGGAEVGGSSRRAPARLTRVKTRGMMVGEMGVRGPPVQVLTADRAHGGHHPSMTVMKLPPLDTTAVMGKGSGRDLVCVGKN